jgi:hypothetical protein
MAMKALRAAGDMVGSVFAQNNPLSTVDRCVSKETGHRSIVKAYAVVALMVLAAFSFG